MSWFQWSPGITIVFYRTSQVTDDFCTQYLRFKDFRFGPKTQNPRFDFRRVVQKNLKNDRSRRVCASVSGTGAMSFPECSGPLRAKIGCGSAAERRPLVDTKGMRPDDLQV